MNKDDKSSFKVVNEIELNNQTGKNINTLDTYPSGDEFNKTDTNLQGHKLATEIGCPCLTCVAEVISNATISNA